MKSKHVNFVNAYMHIYMIKEIKLLRISNVSLHFELKFMMRLLYMARGCAETEGLHCV